MKNELNHADTLAEAVDTRLTDDMLRFMTVAEDTARLVGDQQTRVKSVTMRFSADNSVYVSVTKTSTRYIGNPYRSRS